jgi:hypothetical protein
VDAIFVVATLEVVVGVMIDQPVDVTFEVVVGVIDQPVDVFCLLETTGDGEGEGESGGFDNTGIVFC